MLTVYLLQNYFFSSSLRNSLFITAHFLGITAHFVSQCTTKNALMSPSCTISEIFPLLQCTWLPVTARSPSVSIHSWNYTSRV